MDKYIVALDQGTTSSRAIVFNKQAQVVAQAQREFKQIYPKAGWVEHDPMEIWSSQSSTLIEAVARAGIRSDDIAALGITNQRETTIVWEKSTGRPIYNAIVWQCRRSVEFCEHLRAQGHEQKVKDKTGLVLDPYFSASKIRWILDNVEGAQQQADNGELLFGTVDTWLVWKLTEGKVHVTDPTNASRTMLFNINTQQWDNELLALFNIPESMLPQVKPSSCEYGHTRIVGEGSSIAISGIAGDQQAALFGQLCVEQGSAKNTYGTGCFMLMNTGENKVESQHGLITTLAVGDKGQVTYALEGSVFMGGAVVQWLRDELGLLRNAKDSEYFAQQVEDNNGVYMVPAFVGLGAPYWQADTRGTIVGLTRGANRNHIIRAGLEAIAYQSKDLLDAMQQDSGIQLSTLKVDGGAVNNEFLMQFQSDICDITISRPDIDETTALGAAFLAGLSVNFWGSIEELKQRLTGKVNYQPQMSKPQREQLYHGWKQAVNKALD